MYIILKKTGFQYFPHSKTRVNWKPLILDSQLAILAAVASDEQLGDTGTVRDVTELCRLIF